MGEVQRRHNGKVNGRKRFIVTDTLSLLVGGFAVHPKRWVVERSLAWLTAHRRLASQTLTERGYRHPGRASLAPHKQGSGRIGSTRNIQLY